MCFTNKPASWILLFFFATLTSTLAQENLTGYWQPSIAVNYKVTETYTHNFSIQNRNYTFDDEEWQLNVRQLDFVHFSNLQVQDNQSVALGILYRIRETFDGGANEVRLTQQYNLQSKPNVIRFGHRLRTEQRITTAVTTHRFRYRFSLDFPLKGEQLDVGEPYVVGNFENLLSLAKETSPQYDSRLTLNLGWKLSHKTKFQIGTEYRIEDYAQNLQHVLFLLSTFNISL